MPLAKTLSESHKIAAYYKRYMQEWPDDMPEDTITIMALFEASARPDHDGVKIQSIIGHIYSARMSLRGLERLVNDENVKKIECGLIP